MKSSKKMPARFKLKVGDKIKVLKSVSLDAPAARGTVVGLDPDEPCYSVQIGDDAQDICEIDHDGTVLMGPPLRGKLVRAP